MRYIVALLTAAIALIGLFIGAEIGFDVPNIGLDTLGLGFLNDPLSSLIQSTDAMTAGGIVGGTAVFIGFLINYLFSRRYGDTSFFSMLIGFLVGLLVLTLGVAIAYIGYATFVEIMGPGPATGSRRTRFLATTYNSLHEQMGPKGLGILIGFLGSMMMLGSLLMIAKGNDDDEDK